MAVAPLSIAQLKRRYADAVAQLTKMRKIRARAYRYREDNIWLKERFNEARQENRELRARYEKDQYIIWQYQHVFSLIQDDLKKLSPAKLLHIFDILDLPRGMEKKRRDYGRRRD